MREKVAVWVEASDLVTSFGIRAQLNESAELELVDGTEVTTDTVVLLAVDHFDDRIRRRAEDLTRAGCTRFVLITSVLDDEQLHAAAEIRVCAVIHRRDTTPAELERLVVKAVGGQSELPTELLSQLFRQVAERDNAVQRTRALPFAGLTTRESQILRLIADGLDTDEIALQLSYSSRTVKNVLHAVTTRFCLRNRSHAVAYAMREGLI
ncbi:LuxR C-terminal-related transcriptional regulator [Amycolatopsis sp. NPDC049252]|uniref:helix-turn-helix transcriptional regulator n=1 Tax=Amycolatopsis sp. NPDC049252 TaxID=3363933 RepID=UPI0037134392